MTLLTRPIQNVFIDTFLVLLHLFISLFSTTDKFYKERDELFMFSFLQAKNSEFKDKLIN